MPIVKTTSAWIVVLCALIGVAVAQEPEESVREAAERDVNTPSGAVDERAAGGAIPFEQVLTAPNDIRLNLAYARQQIDAGDLKEGASALERILLINPELHDVRVLYGLVLYRLGLLDRARFELEAALASDELSPSVRAEAEAYLKRIKYQQRTTRGSLTLTAGVEWDHNRNQATSSGQLLFLDVPLPAQPRIDDFAYVVSARGRISHDLGVQAGHMLHAEATYYRSDKFDFDSLDLDVASTAIGGVFYMGRLSFTPRFRFGYYWLDGSDYLRTLGGELDIVMRWRPDFKTYLNIRGDDEDFRATPNYLSAALRSGKRYSVRGGGVWHLSPTQSVAVEGLYMDKQGQTGFESYARYGASAQHTWLLGRGAFTVAGVWAEKSDYDASDPFVSAQTREEWLYRARFTVGAPLDYFASNLPESIGDINIIAQYEYETADSNILNYDYSTNKVNLMLSKRIAF